MNIFEAPYHLQEKSFVEEKMNGKEYNKNGIKLFINKEEIFRMDGSLYRWFNPGIIKDIPTLLIDGKLWMSLTPMEIETHYVPIRLAKGRVGVAGLGLGYYVLRILEKEEVEEVVVYEIEQRVIDYYLEMFGSHPKLTIIKQDVREVEGEEFDFFYNDIYLEMLDAQGFKDRELLMSRNEIKDYHFWTMDLFIISAIKVLMNSDEVPFNMTPYLDMTRQFLSSDKENLMNLYLSEDDVAEALEEAGITWMQVF